MAGWMQNAWNAVGSYFGMGKPNTVDRRDYLAEKIRSSMDVPAFFPYFDEQENLGETQVMRLAYRRMLSCPNVKAALFGKLFGVMSLDPQFHEANDTPAAKEHADFCNWNVTRRCKGGLPSILWSILSGACIDGLSICEPVWTMDDSFNVTQQPLIGTGDRFSHKRVLRDFKAKDVNQDLVPLIDSFKNIWGIMGLRYNAGEVWSPKDFCIYAHLSLVGNPLGMSDLRAAYGRWWLLDTVTKLRGLGAEKRALPVIWGEYPDPSKQSALEAVLKEIKSANWFAVPKDVRMNVMEMAGSSNDYFSSFRKDLQEEIFLAIQLATLQALTGGAGQQRGASAVHKDTADLGKWFLSSVVTNLFNDYENGLIRNMLVPNYRDVRELPHMSLSGVDDAELGESLKIDQGLDGLGYKLSRKELGEKYGRKWAEGPEDELQPRQAGPTGIGDLVGQDMDLGADDHAFGGVGGQDAQDAEGKDITKLMERTDLTPEDVRAAAKRIATMSDADLARVRRAVRVRPGGPISRFAERIHRTAAAPTAETAAVQIKHMAASGSSPIAIASFIAKVPPAERERLASRYGMDTANFIFTPGQIAGCVTDGYAQFDDSGGRWVTIGQKGEDGHGGSPVFIKDGKITKGAPAVHGKHIDDIDKNKPKTKADPHPAVTHPNKMPDEPSKPPAKAAIPQGPIFEQGASPKQQPTPQPTNAPTTQGTPKKPGDEVSVDAGSQGASDPQSASTHAQQNMPLTGAVMNVEPNKFFGDDDEALAIINANGKKTEDAAVGDEEPASDDGEADE